MSIPVPGVDLVYKFVPGVYELFFVPEVTSIGIQITPVRIPTSDAGIFLDTTVFTGQWDGPFPRPCIILVHAFGMDKSQYCSLAELLAHLGYMVVAYTLRGFSGSDGTVDLIYTDQDIDDLMCVAAYTKCPKPIVFGLSYGCGIVIRAALKHPSSFHSCVLLSPMLNLYDVFLNMDPFTQRQKSTLLYLLSRVGNMQLSDIGTFLFKKQLLPPDAEVLEWVQMYHQKHVRIDTLIENLPEGVVLPPVYFHINSRDDSVFSGSAYQVYHQLSTVPHSSCTLRLFPTNHTISDSFDVRYFRMVFNDIFTWMQVPSVRELSLISVHASMGRWRMDPSFHMPQRMFQTIGDTIFVQNIVFEHLCISDQVYRGRLIIFSEFVHRYLLPGWCRYPDTQHDEQLVYKHERGPICLLGVPTVHLELQGDELYDTYFVIVELIQRTTNGRERTLCTAVSLDLQVCSLFHIQHSASGSYLKATLKMGLCSYYLMNGDSLYLRCSVRDQASKRQRWCFRPERPTCTLTIGACRIPFVDPTYFLDGVGST